MTRRVGSAVGVRAEVGPMNRWLPICAWASILVVSAGCELASFSLTASSAGGTTLDSRLWRGAFEERWNSYDDYFLSWHSKGRYSSGYEHTFHYLSAKLRE